MSVYDILLLILSTGLSLTAVLLIGMLLSDGKSRAGREKLRRELTWENARFLREQDRPHRVD